MIEELEEWFENYDTITSDEAEEYLGINCRHELFKLINKLNEKYAAEKNDAEIHESGDNNGVGVDIYYLGITIAAERNSK